jgi:hypothetical protein
MQQHTRLRHDLHLYLYLRQKLLDAVPDADEDTIRDTLEGITTFNELLAETIRSAILDEALSAGLRSRLQDMKHRLARLEARAIRKRELALHVMSEAGLRRVEQPDFTASARAGTPSLLIVAEQEIPESYWVPQPPKLDRQSLLAALKHGESVSGAQLSNPKQVLSLRTK